MFRNLVLMSRLRWNGEGSGFILGAQADFDVLVRSDGRRRADALGLCLHEVVRQSEALGLGYLNLLGALADSVKTVAEARLARIGARSQRLQNPDS